MMIEGSIFQEDTTILNVYGPNMINMPIMTNNEPQNNVRINQNTWGENTELKGEIDKFTIVVQDSNTPLSAIYKSNRQKISKDKVDLSNSINQLNLIDIYRLLHLIAAKYTFISSSPGTFTAFNVWRLQGCWGGVMHSACGMDVDFWGPGQTAGGRVMATES